MKWFAMLAVLSLAACGGCDDDSGGTNNTPNNGSNNENNESNNANNEGSNNANNEGSNNANKGDPFDPDETKEEYCAGDGPPIIVGDQGGSTTAICTGDLAQVTFRYALCVCENYRASGTLMTDSFDSSQGVYNPNAMALGGAVGVNGDFQTSTAIDIGGTCIVGGDGGIGMSGPFDVAYQLRDAGRLTSSDVVTIGDDAYVGGQVAVSELNIAGDLHMPAGETLTTTSNPNVIREDIDVPSPCDCEDLVDIASFVELNEQYNHNDDLSPPLDPDLLSAVNTPVTVPLDCGRFYLSEIKGSETVTFEISGRVALFIGGNIEASGDIIFDLGPDAEIDVFVGGRIGVSSPFSLGSEDRPSAARLYVAGDSFSFSDQGVVAGNIYAPNAQLTFSGALEVYGSVFARNIGFSDSLTIHYDEAILTAGEACSGDGGGMGNNNNGGRACDDCKDCGNQACNDGECGECEIAADCCSPLICLEGRCVPYIQ